MIVRATTRSGAVILSKGETVGEIAKEIDCSPELVWRSIRQHCMNAARAGTVPNIEPEHWLWKHKGDISTIRVIRNKEIETAPRIQRNTMAAGRNVKD